MRRARDRNGRNLQLHHQGGWIGAAIGAAGLVGSAFLGKSGAAQQNTRSIEEARRQEAFQERMSGTAYQRSALDLEAAGLNRILAMTSPATTPGGSAAPIVNELEQAANSAARTGEMVNLSANTKLQRKQALTQEAQKRNLNFSSGQMHTAANLNEELLTTERFKQGHLVNQARNQGQQALLNSAKARTEQVTANLYETAGGTALKVAEKLGITPSTLKSLIRKGK